ncbi:MAG: ATP-binding cassette domain-containing protein [Candidimonas sp.]|nr:MAG: ATP-binding cassette domain-containing protein [Candidimonas sp.]TAM19804.1 MAG: ATP-binding cassette domain-containing protein [Candidimonas sp.]TAM79021.1 MAG: ATP-binding cassette domain-containing protein [Candidimonas sp.]
MIRLENLTKIFETRDGTAVAADHINMNVPEGEICILLGPSGCGKTTTLKMINRLVPPTSGKVFIGNQDTSSYDTIALRRGIGYVIQQIGLFPNMTVAENIGVVPHMLGWDRRRIKQRVEELLEMVTLDPAVFMTRFPKELSGGQQQRIGVARALAADPPVLLMDEPFGAIDPINRAIIQDEFLKMQQKLGKTILFVSHDIDEAVKMGDKVAIFNAGKLEQFDTPDNVLAHPVSDFIADFVGRDRTLKRLPLASVADAMDANPPCVSADDPVQKAAGLMAESGYVDLAVVDAAGKVQGVMSGGPAAARQGVCRDHCCEIKASVTRLDDLRTVVSLMFANELTWLACVDEHGRYQGCITLTGITRFLGQTYRDLEREE